MTAEKVDHSVAGKILERAVEKVKQGYKPQSKYKKAIKAIIQGGHKTFRYILLTGLLAKATNPKVNALALQAKAKGEGAYDARSLCHKVIVPNEKRLLKGGLGLSNEPYLNKPARFPLLDSSNAVRKGKDRTAMEEAIAILRAADKASVSEMLADAVYFILGREQGVGEVVLGLNNGESKLLSPSKLSSVLNDLLGKSVEGEVPTLVAALLLRLTSGDVYKVCPHITNQSGASSREFSDIDVYTAKRKLAYGVEVKDKPFDDHDVIHAAAKLSKGKPLAKKLIFMKGSKAVYTGASEANLSKKCALELGVDVHFVEVRQFAGSLVGILMVEGKEIVEIIESILVDIRAKDATVAHVKGVLSNHGLVVKVK